MTRHYGMDWLRIGAFALLILYHVGMFFVHWPWHVKTAQPMDWVAVPMLATSAWRLSLLFVVSGFASAALLARGGSLAAFAGSRSMRLLVPLVFAAAIVVPPQPWVELVTQHGYARDFWTFWTRDYFRFGTLDGIVLPTWQHLWFVVYLWVYTLALAGLLALTPLRVRSAIVGICGRMLSGIGILVVPLVLLIADLALAWPPAAITHALFGDWSAHRLYFPMFLFGVLLARSDAVWTAIRRWWKAAGVVALAGYAVVAAIELTWPGTARPPEPVVVAFRTGQLLLCWGAIIALIGLADRYWNRDHRLRPMLTEAVFPFYIIHQTIIVVCGFWLLALALPPIAEFIILVAVTILGCWLFYWAGRSIPVLRPLIGLRTRVAGPSPSARARSDAEPGAA